MLKFYARLLELPLFMGIGKNDLTEIIETTRFGFLKITKNEILTTTTTKANRLYFLIDGSLYSESKSDDNSYTVIEEMKAPLVIQPENIFGVHNFYTKSYIAKTECSILYIDKQEILRLSSKYLVFQLNFINIICTQAQRNNKIFWQRQPKDIRNKLIHFIQIHCNKLSGRKIIKIKMQTLADNIHESRLNISNLLKKLQQENLLIQSRGKIIIPQIEKFNIC